MVNKTDNTEKTNKIEKMYNILVDNVKDIDINLVDIGLGFQTITIPIAYYIFEHGENKPFRFYLGISGPINKSEYMYTFSTSNLVEYFHCPIYFPTLLNITSDVGIMVGTLDKTEAVFFSKIFEIQDDYDFDFIFGLIKDYIQIIVAVIYKYNEEIVELIKAKKDVSKTTVNILRGIISFN